MKFPLTIFMLLVSQLSFSQACDTLGSINCIDKNGLKQGLWEEQGKRVLSTIYSNDGGEESCQINSTIKNFLLARGTYKNSVKDGLWTYYSEASQVRPIREISYSGDGAIIDNNINEHYSIAINKDSSQIIGSYYHELDSLAIICKLENCKAILSNGIVLLNFKLKDFYSLEFQFMRLSFGIYNKEIALKMEKG